MANYHNINCVVLEWHKTNLIQNFHDAARKARYQLMTDWCHNNNYSSLLTAHHANDQLETFLMRVKRGAGIEGLSAIKAINIINGIKIIRPLLFITKKEIIQYLSRNNIVWIEDRANYNEIYERSQIRKMMNNLEGDLIRGVGQTSIKMQNTIEAMDYYVVQEFIKNVILMNGHAHISIKFLELPCEISLRILKKLFILIGKKSESRIFYNELLLCYEEMQLLKVNIQIYNCTILYKIDYFLFYNKNSF